MKFLIATIFVLATSAQASWKQLETGGVTCNSSNPGTVIKGGVNPWPWGMEVMFPWTGIAGVWQMPTMGCSTLFVFKVAKDLSNNERYITITQYDPVQCRQISSGVGYEQDRVVRAVMTGSNGSFELTIHAFRAQDLQARSSMVEPLGANFAEPGAPIVVMRTRPIGGVGGGGAQRANFKLQRLQKSPAMLCQ